MRHPGGEVLTWGLPRLRDLPWRNTRDPWAVLVSEVMLQQTQVNRVLPKWESFMDAFPTTTACAEAALGDVLRVWQGLGYPRRARNLHSAAVTVEQLGAFPDTLDGLLALPGVGAYTARAVLAFAYERDAAVVDTNIARVLARFAGRRLTPKEAQAAADAAVPTGHGWEWNQCLMDLGALVCRPTPSCAECPLRRRCAWKGKGPDPAIGSAGVSRAQAPFEGSDRQARGRLLRAVAEASVRRVDAASLMAVAPDRADRLVAALVADGLLVVEAGRLRLP
ncbi:MAG: A/G-specific adenine glycosylase [Actinomycetota bacterium]